MESIVKTINKFQSMAWLPWTSPIKPNNDLAAIINKEVPTANFIGIFAKSTKAGIIRNPPPAPTKPVNVPTKAPSNNIIG